MSSETRHIRPFDVDDRLDRLFETARLHFGSQICQPNSSIIVDDPELFAISKAELELTSEYDFKRLRLDLKNGCIDSGLATSLLSLIIVARTSYLNLADIVKSYQLDKVESLPRKVDLTNHERPRALQATTHGARIDVYIILNTDINPKALRPSRKGTWLAHTSFRIRTLADSVLFRPYPLDTKTRKQHGLGKNSARFFELRDHDLTEPYDSTEPPRLYVDSEMLAQLDANRNSATAIAMQRQLIIDFIAGVIIEFARRYGVYARNNGKIHAFKYDDLKDSLIGRIAKLVAASYGGDDGPSQIINQMQIHPSKVIARAESAISHRNTLLKSLKGTE